MKIIEKILNIIKTNRNKFFGLTFIYVLSIGIIIGLYYLGNINDAARKKILPALPDSTAAMQDLKIVEAKITEPIEVMKMKNPDPVMLNTGKALFEKVCASCHGIEGKGNGAGAAGLNPQPRNFTLTTGWKNGSKLSQIYKTLMEGFAGSSMIAYDYLTPYERFAAANYIRATFQPGAPIDTDEELNNLDVTYSLSKGKESSAQIPIKSAIKYTINDFLAKAKIYSPIVEKIKNSNDIKGRLLFKQVIKNTDAAIMWLSENNFGSVENFRSAVTRKVNTNGFNREVNNLTYDQWYLLFNFTSSLFIN